MFECELKDMNIVLLNDNCNIPLEFEGGAVRCQENARFAVRDRFPETTFPIPTDTPEESGMLTSRL